MPIGDHLLTMKAEHRRPIRVADGSGGHTTTYPKLGTMKVRIWPATARDREQAGTVTGVVSHNLVASPTADLQRNDRLVFDGKTYTVLALADPSVRSHHRKAFLEEVQEGV